MAFKVSGGVRRVREKAEKEGLKTAKPHRNMLKNGKSASDFSLIPKPHIHGGHNMKADISKTCDIFDNIVR